MGSTIGAGDTFIAGVLYGLLRSQGQQEDYQRVLSFANRLAGLKVQRDGFDGLAEDAFGLGSERDSDGSQSHTAPHLPRSE